MKFFGTKGSDLNQVLCIALNANNPDNNKTYITSNTLSPAAVEFLCKEWLSGVENPNTSGNTAEYFILFPTTNRRVLIVRYRDPVCTTRGFSSNYATYVFKYGKNKEWSLIESHPGIVEE